MAKSQWALFIQAWERNDRVAMQRITAGMQDAGMRRKALETLNPPVRKEIARRVRRLDAWLSTVTEADARKHCQFAGLPKVEAR